MIRSPVALIASLLSIVAVPVLLAAATVLPGATQEPASEPQEPASVHIARGKISFRIYCRSCHGAEAHGDGPLAQELKTKPADLSRLRAKDGSFPQAEIAAKIDGRSMIKAHGPSDMPVWGYSFQVAGSDAAQDEDVRKKIEDLVAYLETLQAK